MKRFSKNIPQKVLAFSIAIFVWALAPTSSKKGLTEIQLFVPVSYINSPKDLLMISKPLQTVSISVSVAPRELAEVHPANFQAVIDLEDAVPGTRNYSLRKSNIKTPKGVRILSVNPDVAAINFEEALEKELPIHPVLVGSPAKGFVLEKVSIMPDRVKVRGPSKMLSSLDQLETRALNIDTVNGEIEMFAQINWPEGIKAIPPVPDVFTARIQVGSEPINRRFDAIPLGLVNQLYVTRVNPKTFHISIRGPKSLVENMTPADIQAFIDLKDYKPGTYKIKSPTVRLRPEIQIQEVWPPIDLWVLNQKIYE